MAKRKAKRSIAIPDGWSFPRYHFNQLTTAGLVTGMEYKPHGYEASFGSEGQWFYWVIQDVETGDIFSCCEADIELPSIAEVEILAQAQIEIHQRQIASLREQMKIARKEQSTT